MIKRNTIIILTIIFFTVLNLAPFLMVSCTETDGSKHLENIFNWCCSSSMPCTDCKTVAYKTVSITASHCLCSTNITSQVYLIPKYDTADIVNISTSLFNRIKENILINNNNISTCTSELPPISNNLAKSTILLI